MVVVAIHQIGGDEEEVERIHDDDDEIVSFVLPLLSLVSLARGDEYEGHEEMRTLDRS